MGIHNLPTLPIGTQVRKTSSKPFKSGEKVNTIKGYMTHPKLNVPCYTFEEDESYVEVRRCLSVVEDTSTLLANLLSNTNVNLKPMYGFCSDDYTKETILKVISDIYHETNKTSFQFNIKSNNVIKTFLVDIKSWAIKYLLPLDNKSRDWLIAEEGEYPEWVA